MQSRYDKMPKKTLLMFIHKKIMLCYGHVLITKAYYVFKSHFEKVNFNVISYKFFFRITGLVALKHYFITFVGW